MSKNSAATITTQLSEGLVYLLLGDDAPVYGTLPKHVSGQFLASAKEFDGWEPFDATITAVAGEEYGGGPIDCVTAMPDRIGGKVWYFTKVAKLSPQHWRNRLNMFPPQSFDFMFRSIDDTGIAQVSMRLPLIRTTDAVRIHPQMRKAGHEFTDIVEEIGSVILEPGVPLSQTFAALSTHRKRYYWNIHVGFPGHPRARLATDPKGVRAFFTNRDVGASGRRDALLHWVKGHWRKRRPPNEDDALWVNEHLRGQQDFTWNGMRGEVVPAAQAAPQVNGAA